MLKIHPGRLTMEPENTAREKEHRKKHLNQSIIFQVPAVKLARSTPWKFNIDTKKDGLEDVSPFKPWQFWVAMLDFMGF